jgi:hypothetical protein
MLEPEIQALERFVADNDDLLALEEQIGRFNAFDALGIARTEIRHSNFLAWLLSPSESHTQGDLFLKPLLMDIFRKARHQELTPPVSPVELDGADLKGVEIRREWKHIDLLITCEEPRFVIAIENKIDSGEHSDQLQRYEDIVAREFRGIPSLYVFLTPDGDDASDDDWVTYSYADLFQTLTRTRRTNASSIGGAVAVFLDHYLSLIGNRFMENPELDRLCRQIYTNHRQALDLIWERVGSPSSGLVGAIERWIRDRPDSWICIRTKEKEVEFIPRIWDKMLPAIGKRKTFDATHWITVRLNVGSDRIRLFVVMCPTSDPIVRKLVLERLLQEQAEFGFISFFKKKELLSSEWTRLLSEDVCSLPEDGEPDIELAVKAVEERLSRFLAGIDGVPKAIKAAIG